MMKTYIGRHAGAYIEDKIVGARQSVKISSPWISSDYARFIGKLVDNKVNVKIITSDKAEYSNTNNSHNDESYENSLDILRGIKKSQKDVLSMNINRLGTIPISYKIVKSAFIHAKLYIVDGSYAAGGSANFTKYGQSKNVEHVFYSDSKEEVKALEEDYERLWSSFSDVEVVEDSSSLITDTAREIIKGAKSWRR